MSKRRGARQAEVDPALPVGPEGVGGLHLHERGERLVEPDAVPPPHGHEVAEPHVGELVGDDVGDALQLGLGGRVGVDEQQHLAEGDAAEVLHGPEGEVGDGDEVELVRPGRGWRSSRRSSAGRTAPTSRAYGVEVRLARAGGRPAAARRRRRPGRSPRAGRRRRPRGRSTSASCRRSAPRTRPSPVGSRPTSAAFDSAVRPSGTTSVTANDGLERRARPSRGTPCGRRSPRSGWWR